MIIYLAGGAQGPAVVYLKDYILENAHELSILESFAYASSHLEALIPHLKNFLLDSGAFTYLNGTRGNTDWNKYLQEYADFINRNNVENFFELDIDTVVGYDNVLKMREKLEYMTGKKCIPVWHYNRGKEEFLKMCEEYDYVAIGGLLTDKVSRSEFDKYIPWFTNEAHKRGTKIHGLGITTISKLGKFNFDTVDSTSWTAGNRFGSVFRFNGTEIETIKKEGSRIGDPRLLAINNFKEWHKLQKYAEKYM